MSKLVKNFCFILLMSFLLNAGTTTFPIFTQDASAAGSNKTNGKKAKWNAPPSSYKSKSKKKTKATKYKAKSKAKKKTYVKKSTSPKKNKFAKKPVKNSGKKYKKLSAKVPMSDPMLKVPTPKKVKAPKPKPAKKPKVLTIEPNITDEDIDDRDERSTSPLLIVFIMFVLCCIGGMFHLNSRRKLLEHSRANFQENSNHELAFGSRSEAMDYTHSSNRAPSTGTLFERTDRDQRRITGQNSTAKKSGILGKLSSKAASFIRSSSKRNLNNSIVSQHRGSDVSFPDSAEAAISQFDHEDTSFASITTIGAVRSTAPRSDTRQPTQSSGTASTQDSTTNTGSIEPCSFEKYVEIQVAAQCWRAQKFALDPKLRETFGINTEELIQFEFYWKQKISGNINLRKKYQELEPLYSAKYQAA